MADCCKAYYEHPLWCCCPHCGSMAVKYRECFDCRYSEPVEYEYDDNYQDGNPC